MSLCGWTNFIRNCIFEDFSKAMILQFDMTNMRLIPYFLSIQFKQTNDVFFFRRTMS